MSFTEAQLYAQLSGDGLGVRITQFNTTQDGNNTAVYVENLNSTTTDKSGWTLVAQSNTPAQAAAAIRANLRTLGV
jgi:hypothetical protein